MSQVLPSKTPLACMPSTIASGPIVPETFPSQGSSLPLRNCAMSNPKRSSWRRSSVACALPP